MKKTVSLMIVLAMSLSLFSTVWAAESVDDLQGHWAEANLRKWAEADLLKGYDNGSYQPNRPVTRAEMITLINRSFQLTDKGSISFSDLANTNWAYSEIAIAVKAGYVKGYDNGTIGWNKQVTREEAASMIASLLKLNSSNTETINSFKDITAFAAWSKPAVAALVEAGVMNGYPNEKFAPKGNLTRAEAITALEKAIGYAKPTTTYSVAGVYGPETGSETIKGNVVVAASGVTLRNLIIEGDLTLTAAVGEGDAYFKKVTVKGSTTIQGGGPNSVHFEDSVLVRISVDKRDGTVRVVVVGESSIQYVVVNSPVKLEESNVTGSGFQNVELSKALPTGSEVQLVGQFETVQVLASDIKVSVPSGKINQLNVEQSASNTKINLSKEATIMKLVLDAVASLLGQGTVEAATINKAAAGSSFETKPNKADGESANTAVTTPPSSGGSSNSGGNGNGSGNGGGEQPGEEPGEEEPETTCTEGVWCKDATLSGITVGELTLNQLDANYYTTGQTGFKSDVLGYSIVTDRTMSKTTVPVTVTASVYSNVGIWVEPSSGDNSNYYTLSDGSKQFDLEINPLEDIRIWIYVTSGDGIFHKYYQIQILYPRTIQEAFKIHSDTYYNINKDGVTVPERNYILQSGALLGERLTSEHKYKIFQSKDDPNPIFSCENNSCWIPTAYVPKGKGEWYLKVYKADTLITEGVYQYDLTTVPRSTSDFGLETKPFTKQQLVDAFVNDPTSTPYSFAYNTTFNKQKLLQVHPDAKFISIGFEVINEAYGKYPADLSKDYFKVTISPEGYPGYAMSSARKMYFDEMDNFIAGTHYHTTNNEFIKDMFIIVVFYNDKYELIGYYVTPLTFDQDHVGDGHTAVNTWVPQVK
ncbi:S-layer homology domain-containing protein [Paenibacillus castaneae]|nr:S-layer homology domain-containing protein [Paenibacillus castaneae]